jgi:gliding motility-associated-like protein
MVNNQTYTQSGIYTDTSINANGCLHTDTLYLTINNTANSFTVTECDSYTWMVNNQTYTQSGIYTDTSINTNGCLHTDSLYLTINSSPKAIFSFEQFNMCELFVRFTNTSENFNTSFWRFGDNEYSNYRNPSHSYNKASEYLVNLIVRNNFDCIDSIKTNINLNKSTVFIPNSFTPDNDGLNDKFIIYSDIIQNYELWIYNRWNERVFYSNDVQKNWDGLYKEKECNEGTYTWKLKYSCGEAIKIRVGSVKLIR